MDCCPQSRLFGLRQLCEFSLSVIHKRVTEIENSTGCLNNLVLTIHSCKFTIGRLLMFEGKYKATESILLESQSMWLQGDKSRTLDFNDIIVYCLGCCALMQGNIDVAL